MRASVPCAAALAWLVLAPVPVTSQGPEGSAGNEPAATPVPVPSAAEPIGAADHDGQDLRGADLGVADLRGASFRDADLSGADLTQADLAGADLAGATLRGARFAYAILATAQLVEVDAGEADFESADLTGADLSGADLTGASFDHADLTGARLHGATLDRVSLGTAKSLAGVDLTEADLRGAGLEWADLRGADLSGVTLPGADLAWADLAGASLRGADLTGVDLGRTSLTDADLGGADLTGAWLVDADLGGADLTGTHLDRVNLAGATGLTDAMLARILGVPESELWQAVADRGIRLEHGGEILGQLQPVCFEQAGLADARPYTMGSGFHALVVIGDSDHRDEASRWEPGAARFTELVACVEKGHWKRRSCGRYVPEPGALGSITERFRVWQEWTVTIREARDGSEVARKAFRASGAPEACPGRTTSTGDFYGPAPRWKPMRDFLLSFVGTPGPGPAPE